MEHLIARTRASDVITRGLTRTPNRSMFYALGLRPDDFTKPIIGIASGHSTITPCNAGIQRIVDELALSVKELGGVAQIFGVPTISDGMTMGTHGMRYSLVSREIIADSIEVCTRGQCLDGLIVVGGCDKNMPGGLMAMIRANVPAIYIYGGTILPGYWKGKMLTIVDPFEAVGRFNSKLISSLELKEVEKHACPTTGSCGGMYTANTMSSSFEALGVSLFYSSTMASAVNERARFCKAAAQCLIDAVDANLKPEALVTKESVENAVSVIMAVGGSTNGILHYLALAKTAGIKLTLEDFEAIRRRVPVVCNLKPSGQYTTIDLHRAGGIPQVMKILQEKNVLHTDCLTITGRSLGSELQRITDRGKKRNVSLFSASTNPFYSEGQLLPLHGNLASGGAVAKTLGVSLKVFIGKAKVFEIEAETTDAILKDQIKEGDVVVIRNLGPKGAPGMPEMLSPTSALIGRGLGKKVCLITDGRFSGGSWGMVVGHIAPEGAIGGAIGLVRDGDLITLNLEKAYLHLHTNLLDLGLRRKAWRISKRLEEAGVLKKYSEAVEQSNLGATTV